MELELAAQRIFLLQERLSAEEMQQRAMDRRTNAVASGIGGLLQRPKPEDVVLVGSQRRIEPFWHVAGRARYVYERTREYVVPVPSAEVEHVTVHGVSADLNGRRQFALPVNEHCVEELSDQKFIHAVTGESLGDGATIASMPREEIDDPAVLSAGGTIVVPPEHRSSYVVQTLVNAVTKPVQADAMLEERVTLECTDLYYRPVHAFEFIWQSRDRSGTVEVDALTGQVTVGKSLSTHLAKVLTRDSVFDLGADAAGLLIPGGSIAVKVAKMAIDHHGRA
jgi:hypothetical protein